MQPLMTASGMLPIFGKGHDATNAAETIKSSQDFDASTLPNNDWNYASGESIVTGANTVLNITGATNKHFALESLTVKEGATLKLTNTDKTNTQIFGYAKGEAPAGNKGTLKVDNGNVQLTKASLNINKVDITKGSTLTLGGLVDYNKNADKTKKNDWAYFANVYAVANSGTDAGNGVLTVENSTVNLNHQSNFGGSITAKLDGATVNFAGEWHEKGYATAFVRAAKNDSGTVVFTNNTQLNVTAGHGGAYAKNIDIQGATATIADGKKFVVDGDWAGGNSGDEAVHEAAEIGIKDFTTKGTGTLVLGNKTSGGTTTVSGTTVINTKLENHTALTVSGASAVFELDAKNINADTGLFASKSGTLTISGGKLKLTNLSETLDLANAKQIKFAGTAAQNVIKVDTSGTIEGDNLAISAKITDAGNLSVVAKNLTLGKDGTDSSALNLGIGTGTLAAENVTFKSSANKAFGLQNALTLNSTGNASINGAVETKANGKINITGGNYTLNNGLKITAGDSNVGLAVTNASLKILGAFETTATNGTASLTGANVDASEATSYKFGATTIKMADSSTLTLDGSKWFELGSATGDLVKFKAGVDAKAVSGDKISTLKLTGINSMTMKQFQELKTDTGFAGLFDGFTVTSDQPVAPSIGMGQVESGTPDSVYQGTQATVSGTVADKTASVGSVQLSGTETLTLTSTAGSNLTLTNASANNNANKNFVQKEGSTEAAGVSLSGTKTNLILQGEGNIGAISATTKDHGVVVIGNLDGSKTGNVTVKGNIGETNAIGKVQASNNSTLTVEGTVVQTNELHVMPGAEIVADKADITVDAVAIT